ncbi:hypothetical protein LCGC14_0833350 [marine sediment metagenome]|uniref:Uncharacterized protein n=1 Tax=marine sediment metagenome TaxID=412755 RepID=A0A0F9PFB6_9ZZZZ
MRGKMASTPFSISSAVHLTGRSLMTSCAIFRAVRGGRAFIPMISSLVIWASSPS